MAGIAPITSDLQDAVTLALTFDKAAATAVAANASDDDQALQRKLWLAIARHLITATDNGADNDPVSIPDLLASSPAPFVCANRAQPGSLYDVSGITHNLYILM